MFKVETFEGTEAPGVYTPPAPEIHIPEKPKIKTFEPGWYKELSNDEYHGSAGWSSTKIKLFTEMVAAKVKYELSQPFKQSAAMLLGTICHTLVLESHKFNAEYIVQPLHVKKPTAAQLSSANPTDKTLGVIQDYNRFSQAANGRQIITAEQHATAGAMAKSVFNDKDCADILEDSLREQSVFWWYRSRDPDDDKHYKLMTKVRPDALSKKYAMCIDLKSCQDSTETGFAKSILKFYYHVSAAMYLEGLNQCYELLEELGHMALLYFTFIAVESEPPYLARAFELDKKGIEKGRIIYQRCIIKLRHAIDNEWPSYPPGITTIKLPPYADNLHVI